MATVDTTLYRTNSWRSYPIDDDTMLVTSIRDGTARMLPAADAHLLSSCRIFRTLEEHARTVAESHGDYGRTLGRLKELARLGHLLSDAELAECRGTSDAQATVPPLSHLAVPTANRTNLAVRAIRSYVRHARDYGRHLTVHVNDASIGGDAGHTFTTYQRLAAQEDVDLVYATPPDVAEFARRLSDTAGVPPAIAEFALSVPGWRGERIGANRNALLLQLTNERFLSVDDDTVCLPLTAAVETEARVILRGEGDVPETWIYQSRTGVMRAAHKRALDVFQDHESMLGASLGVVIGDKGWTSAAAAGACSHVLNSLCNRRGTVVATMNGIAGDSGMYSAEAFAVLDAPSLRERVLTSPDTFGRAIQAREVIRHARQPSVCHGGSFMSTVVGLDGRALLPPFFPVCRSEDAIFGATVYVSSPHTYFAHLPWALLHAPDRRRTLANAEDPWCRCRVSDIVLQVLEAWHGGALPDTAIGRLLALGREFVSLSALAPDEFVAVIREGARRRAVAAIRRIEHVVQRFNVEPAFWGREMRRRIRVILESSYRPSYWRPIDLPASDDMNAAGELRRLFGLYGQLLICWPGMLDAARQLRAEGYRVGRLLR